MSAAFLLEHADAEHMLFSVPSRSKPGHRHCLTLDRKRFLVTCSCIGATRWKKRWSMLTGDCDPCVHISAFKRMAAPHLGAWGVATVGQV